MKRKIILLAVIVLSACSVNADTINVTDLKGHWAENTINSLISEGYLAGYSDNTIRPDNTITRAEFISFVNRIFEFEKGSNAICFDLYENKWYYGDMAAAIEKGYISKYADGTVKPESNITRQEAAIIICKILKLSPEENYANNFSDGMFISSWAKGYVGAIYKSNVIQGSADGRFRPLDLMTRAEAFTILKSAAEFYKAENVSEKNTSIELITADATTQSTTNEVTMQASVLNTETKTAVSPEYKEPNCITNRDEWVQEIKYAVDNLYDKISLKIEGFNENDYSIQTLNISSVSITSGGEIRGDIGYIDYEFSYDRENFKLMRAVENPKLMNKLTSEQISAINYLKNTALKITNENMSDYEKEKAIHDFIVQNFNYPNMADNTYFSITGALKTKVAYCDAVANMFYIMMHYAGVECGFIEGTLEGENHLWNYAKIGDDYYLVDVTADLYVVGKENYGITYKVFNVPESWIKDKYVWDKKKNDNIDCINTEYNYYYINNLVFTDKESLASYLETNIVNRAENIAFYTDGFETDENFFRNIDVPSFVKSYILIMPIKDKPQCKIFIPIYDEE